MIDLLKTNHSLKYLQNLLEKNETKKKKVTIPGNVFENVKWILIQVSIHQTQGSVSWSRAHLRGSQVVQDSLTLCFYLMVFVKIHKVNKALLKLANYFFCGTGNWTQSLCTKLYPHSTLLFWDRVFLTLPDWNLICSPPASAFQSTCIADVHYQAPQ